MFTTAFNFVNYHIFAQLAGVNGVQLLGFEARERTDLALFVSAAIDPRTGRLSLRVTGDHSALTTTQAGEYAKTFVRVLGQIVRSPDQLGDYAADELAARDVVQFISEQAAATPAAHALATDSVAWTYAELDGSAERIAAGLITAGMPPGARVGVMLDRVAGTDRDSARRAKAGAAVVPCRTELPAGADRRDDRSSRAVQGHLRCRRSPRVDTRNCGNDVTGDQPRERSLRNVHIGFDGRTQGRHPMPHQALNLIRWQNRRASGAVGGSTLQFFPLSFDVSFQEIFSTLCGGGTLRLVTDAQRKDLPRLVRLVADEGIERVFLPCVALQAFAEAAHVTRKRLESLHVVINVGEQLRVTPEIRRRVR